MLALHLLQSALVHFNTLLLEKVLVEPRWRETTHSPPVRTKEKTLQDLAEGLTREDLVRLTNQKSDRLEGLIAPTTNPDPTP